MNICILIGLDILPIDNEDTKESAALEIDIEFKRLSAILREELEKFDFSKYERYQKMTVNEMINFDNNFDTNMELNNQEIYDLVTEKINEEKEEEKESPPNVVTFSEASKALNTLKNFIEQSEDFNEQDFYSLSSLTLKLDTLREKNRIQQKISTFFNHEDRMND